MNHTEIATSIVQTLKAKGFIAYFAGGWVRDFLLGHPSQDIDIATDATPEQLTEIFPRTLLVGAKFGVIIVILHGHHFEVATFRKDSDYHDGRRPHTIEFSSAQEDALRRDFTINGMFYDPIQKEVLDFVGGKQDLTRQVIRTIGNPQERFAEDRLRLIRAVRFACKFNFELDKETEQAIIENAPTILPACSMERIWQELCKMRLSPSFPRALVELHRLKLLPTIFPDLKPLYIEDIEKQIAPLAHYPETCPTILCLMTLFEGFPLEKWLEIGKYLKVPNADLKLLEFFYHSERVLAQEIDAVPLWQWAHFYAHKDALLVLDIVAIRLPNILKQHAKQRHFLHDDILRVAKKLPLVTSDHLLRTGVKPGPKLGQLLLLAEQIAINERLHHPEDVLHKLKNSPLWS